MKLTKSRIQFIRNKKADPFESVSAAEVRNYSAYAL